MCAFSAIGFNPVLLMESLKYKNEKEYAQILEIVFSAP